MKAKKKNIVQWLTTTVLVILSTTIAWAETQEATSMLPSDKDLVLWALGGALIIQLIIIYMLSDASSLLIKINKSIKNNASIILLFFILSIQPAQAANNSENFMWDYDTLYNLLITANIFLFLIIIYIIGVQRKLIKILSGIEEEEEEASAVESITASLTDAVPIEKEEEILLDHEYDGIRELDNNLPPWWKYMFYITIVFSFFYLIYYHVLGYGDLMIEEYQKEMAQAELEKQEMQKLMANSIDETNVTALTDDASLKEGKEIFKTNCAACHGQNGEGVVGPNLTDAYWIHGGGIKNIFKTIKYGVPAKGMIAWESQLPPSQIQKVASYILTLQGTNPPNAKAPEGEIWKEPANNEETSPAQKSTDSAAVQETAIDSTITAMQ